MDSSSIELPGSRITGIESSNGTVRIHFDPAYIIKTMTGSAERTKWGQKGALIYENAQIEGAIPVLPATCTGGDVGENVYTYRDMIPIPLASQGRAHCELKIDCQESRIRVQGEAVRLLMEDTAKYIEHIRP
ncbi:MAG: hypothetical protein KJ558_15580 [Gammaproteobacteria bacterium]|nr:hypothetical protein [Gammaproteobacteria bacterium]MBU1656209.1 hypothetical protein [Gammaproteobacteria bacterium]MBU1959774.1 hypothetical protein [Gammaproteobacteria bacterium]